jgi:hypothetical protein
MQAKPHDLPQYSPSNPRPSVAEAIERGKMRRAADDRTQGITWLTFLIGLALLLLAAVAVGLKHPDRGEALPPPPPALR